MASAEKYLVLRLVALEGPGDLRARPGDRVMEFHLSRKARVDLGLELSLFRATGNVIIPDFSAARGLARRINEVMDATLLPERAVRAGRINAMGLIDEILHGVSRLFREGPAPDALAVADLALTTSLGKAEAVLLLEKSLAGHPEGQLAVEELIGLGPRCILRWAYAADGLKAAARAERGIVVLRTRDGLVCEALAYRKETGQ